MVALMRRLVLAGLVVAAVAATSASARTTTIISFRTPSRNIACAYTFCFGPTFLRCDIRSHLRPAPRGSCTEGVYGESVGMTRTGRAHVLCISDTVYNPRARVLPYGTTWSFNGFTCVSRATGLTCKNLRGHGFFLSRERWHIY
jgi:uncharacterized protein DUF6636